MHLVILVHILFFYLVEWTQNRLGTVFKRFFNRGGVMGHLQEDRLQYGLFGV